MSPREQFEVEEVRALLVACHRRCCVCHKFCGVKMEIDHIRPRQEGGSGGIENAIALCFDCHAEVHHYNDRHPRGRKFSEQELVGHREQWLRICRETPQALLDAPRFGNPGPLEAILWELHLNEDIALQVSPTELGCMFELGTIRSAIANGALIVLPDEVSSAIRNAFVRMGAANAIAAGFGQHDHPRATNEVLNLALARVRLARQAVTEAIRQLEALMTPLEGEP